MCSSSNMREMKSCRTTRKRAPPDGCLSPTESFEGSLPTCRRRSSVDTTKNITDARTDAFVQTVDLSAYSTVPGTVDYRSSI